MSQLSRREFLTQAGSAGFSAFILSVTGAWGLNRSDNPLASYPDRDWERVYRDLWKSDSTLTFLCAPNDTHNCLLHGYVRSGVVTRIGPTMKYGEAADADRSSMRNPPVLPLGQHDLLPTAGCGTACGGGQICTTGERSGLN